MRNLPNRDISECILNLMNLPTPTPLIRMSMLDLSSIRSNFAQTMVSITSLSTPYTSLSSVCSIQFQPNNDEFTNILCNSSINNIIKFWVLLECNITTLLLFKYHHLDIIIKSHCNVLNIYSRRSQKSILHNRYS